MPEEEKSEDKKINPRWDVINELYDAIDHDMVDLGNKNEMNFVEISMALHMINKKMEYEQFKAMFEFNVEGIAENAVKPAPADGMYK